VQTGSAPHSQAPILRPGWGRQVRHRPGRQPQPQSAAALASRLVRSDRPLLSRRGPFDRRRGKRGHRPLAD
jgi:hypothetical protein